MHVLFCDDDEGLLFYFQKRLESLNCRVSTVASGYEALEVLKKQKLDLVVADYEMPDGDGGMLTSYCVEHSIPCLLVTSYSKQSIQAYVSPLVPIIFKMDFLDFIKSWQALSPVDLSQDSSQPSKHPLLQFIEKAA